MITDILNTDEEEVEGGYIDNYKYEEEEKDKGKRLRGNPHFLNE